MRIAVDARELAPHPTGVGRYLLEILKVWNNLMDPMVAQHAKPVGIAKGTLFVAVDSNVWLDEIVRYRRREILQRLRHAFGPDLIQKISFRVG